MAAHRTRGGDTLERESRRIELEERLLDLQEKRIDIEQKRIELELRKLKLHLRGSRRSRSKRESLTAGDENGSAAIDQDLGEDYGGFLDSGMTTPDDDDYDDDGEEESADDDDYDEKKDTIQSKRRSSSPKRDREGSTHSSSQRSRKGLESGSTDDASSVPSRSTGSKSTRGLRRSAFDPESVSSNDVPPVPSRSSKSARGLRRSGIEPPHRDPEVPPVANSGARTKTKVPVFDSQNVDILYEVASESTQRRRMTRRLSAPTVSSFDFDISNVTNGPVKQASLLDFESTTTKKGSAVPTGDIDRARMQESDATMDDMSVQTEKRSNKK